MNMVSDHPNVIYVTVSGLITLTSTRTIAIAITITIRAPRPFCVFLHVGPYSDPECGLGVQGLGLGFRRERLCRPAGILQ